MPILAGDIGGTKTHLAVYENGALIIDEKYPSKDYSNLKDIVVLFLSNHPAPIEKACFGIAGPIRDGRCHTTNLPWDVDSRVLSQILKTPHVELINDLLANAYGLRCLRPEEFAILNEGKPQIGNAALVSAGTGLGEAGLYWDGKEMQPFPCEGGHADFAPRDELEISFWRYLKKKYSHVSYERVLSGPGFCELFYFLIDEGLEKKPSWFQKEQDQKSLARVVTEKGLNKECSLSVRVLDWFVSLYGAEAGNVALKFLAFGGIYLGGGIAPKIIKPLQEKGFMQAFSDKGRFKEILELIPVKVVLNEKTALAGAAEYAQKRIT